MTLGVPQAVFATILGVYGVLALATAIILGTRIARPDWDLTELRQRTNSWWVMVTIFSLAIVLERGLAIAFLAFVSFLALKEYLSLIPTRRADRRVLFWAYLSVPVQFYFAYTHWYGMFIIFIPVWVFLFLPLRMLFVGVADGFLRAVGTLQWGLMTTVFCLSHAAFLLSLPKFENPMAGNAGLLLFLVLLTQFNDVAQYVWGKSLGRHKIVPSVSPGKTWEGFLGGIISTAAVSVALAPYLTPFEGWHMLASGIVIAISGFVGDITISAIKRDLGVKNSSSFIPGHGGVLDRVDSLAFSAPVFFHYVYFFFYGARIDTI